MIGTKAERVRRTTTPVGTAAMPDAIAGRPVSPPRWLWRVATITLVAVALTTAAAAGADVRHGLDARPANPGCLADRLPVSNALVKAVPAFGGAPFQAPIEMRPHPLQGGRWYVAERAGVLKSFSDPAAPAVALDIRDRMAATEANNTQTQQWGITSFAFHPQYAAQPWLYVAYNRVAYPGGPAVSVVSRFPGLADGVGFDAAAEQVLVQLPQQRPWHHFGQLQTGGDGFVYVGSGDGSSGIPAAETWRAQDWTSLNGGIYAIHPDHPAPTIGNGIAAVAKGFRNPWRFSFDRATGDMWVGDVGDSMSEEVNRVVSGGNYGWPYLEGLECRQASCPTTGVLPPTHVFDHADGAAVIGGYVYRGQAIPALQGRYVFGAASHPRLWALDPATGQRVDIGELASGIATGFAEDAAGELYVLDASFNRIWQLLPGDPPGPAPLPPVAERLSQTGCVEPGDPRRFAAGVIPYDVLNPLWSDDTGKARGMALPDGQQIRVRPNGDFEPPPRTVLLKSFSLGTRPIETRLFVRHPLGGGWRGYSYEWADDGSDAYLLSSAKTKTFTRPDGTPFTWLYPSREACLQCHNAAAGGSLSLEVVQLNRDFLYPATGRVSNQLATYAALDLLTPPLPPIAELPALARRWRADHVAPMRRARSYLHANCSFCHRPGGGAQAAVDFRFAGTLAATQSCGAPPLTTDLGIAGARLIEPGHPELSLIALRMGRRDEYAMPPIASTLVDVAAVAQINRWIAGLGDCTSGPDSDADGVPDSDDNCILAANPDQYDRNGDGYGNRCDADVDNDGRVTAADVAAVRVRLGLLQNQPDFFAAYDLDHDLAIDADDLAIAEAMVARADPVPGPSCCGKPVSPAAAAAASLPEAGR